MTGSRARLAGWLAVAFGGVLALPQLASTSPWQGGFALGLVLVIFGIVTVADHA